MKPITSTQAAELVTSFLAAHGTREHTQRAYTYALEGWRAFLKEKTRDGAAAILLRGPRRRAEALARGYSLSMAKEGKAAATIRSRLSVLSSLHAFARAQSVLHWGFTVKPTKVAPYSAANQLHVDDFRRMVSETKGDGPRARRDRAILLTLYDLAVRREVVHELDLDDLAPDCSFVQAKRFGDDETIGRTLPEQTQAALKAWLEVRHKVAQPDERAVFVGHKNGKRLIGTSIWQIVADAGKRIGLKAKPSDLRVGATVAGLAKGSGDVTSVTHFAETTMRSRVAHLDDVRRLPDRAGAVAKVVAAGTTATLDGASGSDTLFLSPPTTTAAPA